MLAARVCSVCIRSNNWSVTHIRNTHTYTQGHEAGIKHSYNTIVRKLGNAIKYGDYLH